MRSERRSTVYGVEVERYSRQNFRNDQDFQLQRVNDGDQVETHMYRTLRLSFMTGALAAGPAATVAAQNQNLLQAKADSLLKAGNFALAAQVWDQLARTFPDSAIYFTRLGIARQFGGQLDAALTAYRTAIARRGGAIPMYNAASIHALRHSTDSAFHWLNAAVDAGFNDARTLATDSDLTSLRGDSRYAELTRRLTAKLEPCSVQKESRAFDFWIGEWDVTPFRDGMQPVTGRSVIQSIAGGCALLEHWTSTRGSSGKSLNAYNADLKRWQQFWVDQSGSVTEYRDSELLEGGGLRFFTWGVPDHTQKVRLTFTPLTPDLVRQHQESSSDGGHTWKTSYDFYYHRRHPTKP